MTGLPILSEAAWLTPARIRRIAMLFAGIALIFLGADVWFHTRAGVTDAALAVEHEIARAHRPDTDTLAARKAEVTARNKSQFQ